MDNTRNKIIDLPKIQISEEELNNITMVNPIEFITEEENKRIIERVKEGLRNINNPERWMAWEETDEILAKKYFGDKV